MKCVLPAYAKWIPLSLLVWACEAIWGDSKIRRTTRAKLKCKPSLKGIQPERQSQHRAACRSRGFSWILRDYLFTTRPIQIRADEEWFIFVARLREPEWIRNSFERLSTRSICSTGTKRRRKVADLLWPVGKFKWNRIALNESCCVGDSCNFQNERERLDSRIVHWKTQKNHLSSFSTFAIARSAVAELYGWDRLLR